MKTMILNFKQPYRKTFFINPKYGIPLRDIRKDFSLKSTYFSCYDNPKVKELSQLVKESKSIIIASPIYMYDLNAAAKNFMELTGRAWTKKIVGFICAAGGKGSYMSVTSYMNSLMLDFRCIVIPRFVYTDGSGFDENYNIKSNIKERIKELVDQTTLLSSKIED